MRVILAMAALFFFTICAIVSIAPGIVFRL